MRQNVRRLVIIEFARQDILVVHRSVLVLDVHHIRYVLSGVVFTRHLLQQLIGGDVKEFHLDAGIFLHKGSGNLGNSGRNRVDSDLSLFLRLLIQLFICFIGIENTGGLFPLGQLQRPVGRQHIRVVRRNQVCAPGCLCGCGLCCLRYRGFCLCLRYCGLCCCL